MVRFEEELCGCFSDFPVCLFGSCIPLGYCFLQAAATSRATGKGLIIPCLIVFCLHCIGGAINRGTIRSMFSIDGGFVEDCCIWYFCGPCAGCQEYREVKKRRP